MEWIWLTRVALALLAASLDASHGPARSHTHSFGLPTVVRWLLMPRSLHREPDTVEVARGRRGVARLRPQPCLQSGDDPVGKRIAYVDVSGVKAVDSLAFNDRQVTILGTMEPVKEGSGKMIIRALLIRPRN